MRVPYVDTASGGLVSATILFTLLLHISGLHVDAHTITGPEKPNISHGQDQDQVQGQNPGLLESRQDDDDLPNGYVRQSRAPLHLCRLSQRADKKIADEEDYVYHESAGQGVTIFIVDTGCDFSTEELRKEFRVENKQPQDYMFLGDEGNNKGAIDVPDDRGYVPMSDSDSAEGGHGTIAASLALGTKYGVAKKADLFCVRGWEYWNFGDGDEDEDDDKVENRNSVVAAAYNRALNGIADTVIKRNLQGKAVVVCTAGIVGVYPDDMNHDKMRLEDTFREFLERARSLGIVVVIAAGNDGLQIIEENSRPDSPLLWDLERTIGMGNSLPALLLAEYPEMIVVGGLGEAGELWPDTTAPGRAENAGAPTEWEDDPLFPENLRNGEWSIFADAEQVIGLGSYGGQEVEDGTSWSTPIVGGLVAYFLAHPDYKDRFAYSKDEDADSSSSFSLRVKKFVQAAAWTRVGPAPWEKLYGWAYAHAKQRHLWAEYPLPLPREIPAAYNLAWGPQKYKPLDGGRDGSDVPNFRYAGCVEDTIVSGLGLSWPPSTIAPGTLELEECAAYCCEWDVFGVSGVACYCGDEYKVLKATVVDEARCNLPCPGDGMQRCGGKDALSWYIWNGEDDDICSPINRL